MWIQIQPSDLIGALSSQERRKYREHSAVAADGDPLPSILDTVTKKVRNAIRSNPNNRLHPDATLIAEECLDAAVCLIRYRLLSIIDDAVSDPRTEEWRDANAFLKDVRAGRATIEQPNEDPEAPQAAPTPSPLITARRRRFGRDQQDGV